MSGILANNEDVRQLSDRHVAFVRSLPKEPQGFRGWKSACEGRTLNESRDRGSSGSGLGAREALPAAAREACAVTRRRLGGLRRRPCVSTALHARTGRAGVASWADCAPLARDRSRDEGARNELADRRVSTFSTPTRVVSRNRAAAASGSESARTAARCIARCLTGDPDARSRVRSRAMPCDASSSVSFSPGRRPMTLHRHRRQALAAVRRASAGRPDRRCAPASHVEPERLAAASRCVLAFMTSDAASVTVMKKRVASGSVTSIGWPWRMRSRITSTKLPLLASTLPKRTTTGRVAGSCSTPGRPARRGAWSRP